MGEYWHGPWLRGRGMVHQGERSPQDHYVTIFNKIKRIYHPVKEPTDIIYNYSCLTKEAGLECSMKATASEIEQRGKNL
jgi:hypothetical protein